MTLRTPAFNDAKTYGAEYLRHLAETMLNSEGVANYATDFVVTPAASLLKVDVAAGAAWVKGDSGTPGMGISQGLYSVVNDATIANAVTLAAADPTNPRLDQIVLRVRDSADLATGADDALIEVVTGTATGGATLLNRTGAAALGNDRLRLADVLVPATATNLVGANVRDRRIPAKGVATSYISAAEATTSTTYTDLTTPDLIEAYVPNNAFVRLTYSAEVKRATQNGQATIYLIDYSTSTPTVTQLKTYTLAGAAVAVQDVTISATAYQAMITQANVTAWGTQPFTNPANSGADVAGVATGMILSTGDGSQILPGNPILIHGLPAGNYGFAVRYKVTAGGTVTARFRRLAVEVVGNGRSA